MNEYLPLRIKQIIRETSDSITLVLEHRAGTTVSYLPGQFLTFLLNIQGRELRRSYSLSSAPGIDADLAVTITRVANGEVSRYLIDHLKEDDILQSLHPAGRFIVRPQTEYPRDIFLIGAGSGVTPLFSMLKTLLITEPQSHITFIDSNKNETTALFWQQLQTLEKQYPEQLTTIHLFSDPLPALQRYPVQLNISLLEKLVSQHLRHEKADARFFVCGPSNFMRMVKMTLVFMGFPEQAIHKENFITQAQTEITSLRYENTVARTVKIRSGELTYAVQVQAHTSILRAALDQGIRLPYSCMAGMCATCAGKCTSGKAGMAVNEVLTDKEVLQGWILICVAFPLSDDVEIEL